MQPCASSYAKVKPVKDFPTENRIEVHEPAGASKVRDDTVMHASEHCGLRLVPKALRKNAIADAMQVAGLQVRA